MSSELYSERVGKPRKLEQDDLATLLWRTIARLRKEGYFTEALDGVTVAAVQVVPPTLNEGDFIRRLKTSGIHGKLVRAATHGPPVSWSFHIDVLFDSLEFLHAEAISKPDGDDRYSKEDGQEVFRDQINPDLALWNPPMEMLSSGQIVEQAPDELRPLLDDPVPDEVPAPLRDPLRGAIGQYRRRGATEHDKRSALKHLADVLEPLRDDIDESLLPADEQALFQIANQFHIRHNNRFQHRVYDGDIWLDWMFYVYVATARALVAALDRERLRDRVLGDPPDDNGGIPF